jgi:hypothetical protein
VTDRRYQQRERIKRLEKRRKRTVFLSFETNRPIGRQGANMKQEAEDGLQNIDRMSEIVVEHKRVV